METTCRVVFWLHNQKSALQYWNLHFFCKSVLERIYSGTEKVIQSMPLTLRCLRRIARHCANHLDKARLWRFAFRHLTAGPLELGRVGGQRPPPLDFGRYRSRTFSFKRPCLPTLPLPDFQIILRTCIARRFCIGGAVPAFGFWINKRSIPTYLSKNELNHIKFWQTCKTNVLTRH